MNNIMKVSLLTAVDEKNRIKGSAWALYQPGGLARQICVAEG